MNIEQIKQANRDAGYYFFEPATLRFFDSRISSRTFGRYFITSEQFHDRDGRSVPRRYTVRKLRENGTIEDIGDFQAYASLSAAVTAAERFSQQVEVPA